MKESGVTVNFCAAHRSPEGVLHGHSYEVTAWFPNEDHRDARCMKAALVSLLSAWDHSELPDHLSWAEDIAAVVGTLANCVAVEVRRPLEGFHGRWRAE